MNRLQLLIKRLLKQGFATDVEKDKTWALFKELGTEEQEKVSPDVEKVDELPEEKPAEAKEGEGDGVAKVEENLEKLFANLETKMGTTINAEVKRLIKEEMELNTKRAGVYNSAGQADEKRKAMNTYLRKFTNALVGEDIATLKEMTTDDQSTPYSGYTVDSELSAEIRHLITNYGVARREMMALQLTKHTYRANNLVTDVIVYWVDEGSAIGSTQAVLGQKTLELKKLGAIVTLTNELMTDGEIDLFSFLAERVAENFAKAEDLAFFKGDGTGTYGSFTGLLKDTTINEVTMTGTTFASVDADDLIDMQDATPEGAQANAKYYMHRTIKSYVRKLKGSDGQYIYARPTESEPAMIWEKPVVTVEAMPSKLDSAEDTSFVLYGDLKKACLFGYEGAIRADMFDTGLIRNVAGNADINLLTTDRVAIRWIERAGFVVVVPSAVTKLTTNVASL